MKGEDLEALSFYIDTLFGRQASARNARSSRPASTTPSFRPKYEPIGMVGPKSSPKPGTDEFRANFAFFDSGRLLQLAETPADNKASSSNRFFFASLSACLVFPNDEIRPINDSAH
jgi:hypothetical protein